VQDYARAEKTDREIETSYAYSTYTVQNLGARFRQRIRTGTWTWQMKRQGQPVRSICDYILGVRGLLSEREVFHQVRRPEYVSTDHRVIYIGLPMGNSKVHQTYMHGRTTFPIAIPVQSKGLVDHLHDSLVKRKKRKAKANPGRPGWISESTWLQMRRKAELAAAPGYVTRLRKRRIKGLKRAIRAGLKRDRQTRLDNVATEIEAAVVKEPKRAFQLLANWYKRKAREGLPLSQEKMTKIEEERTELYAQREPVGEMFPLHARGKFTVDDRTKRFDGPCAA
jgi:hypothetical protein